MVGGFWLSYLKIKTRCQDATRDVFVKNPPTMFGGHYILDFRAFWSAIFVFLPSAEDQETEREYNSENYGYLKRCPWAVRSFFSILRVFHGCSSIFFS